MRKRIAAAFFCCIFAFSLISCASSGSAQTEQTSSESAQAEENEDESAQAAAGTSDSAQTEGNEAESGQSDRPVISFETTDLDGDTVRSEDIFSDAELTFENIWGTFCGPCINEMPDLEVLHQRLAEKKCGIIGIVIDVNGKNDTAMIDAAKEIVGDTGVTYTNLVPWGSAARDFPVSAVPTTYFVDSDGCMVGEPAVGARGADDYEILLEAMLEQIS